MKLTIDTLKTSDAFPMGTVVEWQPQISPSRTRTLKQQKARAKSRIQKSSRKINRT